MDELARFHVGAAEGEPAFLSGVRDPSRRRKVHRFAANEIGMGDGARHSLAEIRHDGK